MGLPIFIQAARGIKHAVSLTSFAQPRLERKDTMNTSTRIGIFGCLIALVFLINPDLTRAQNFNYRGCAWPLELSPEGSGNGLV